MREGIWALSMHVKPTSGSPEGHNGCSSFQRGPLFGRLWAKSFEDDHCHHHNHQHYHNHNILKLCGKVFEHFSCTWNPLRTLQKVATDAPTPNEDLFSDVFWQILLKMTIVMVRINTVIIIIIWYKYKRRCLSTFHACETHFGLQEPDFHILPPNEDLLSDILRAPGCSFSLSHDLIGQCPDPFTRTCSLVRASAKLTEGLWG